MSLPLHADVAETGAEVRGRRGWRIDLEPIAEGGDVCQLADSVFGVDKRRDIRRSLRRAPLARDTGCVAQVPGVVVQDELRGGSLVEYAVVPDLYETFYAITVLRRFAPPPLRELLQRSEAEVLPSLRA